MQNQNHKSSTLWVSLTTIPFLLGRITLESILDGLIEVGKASEEAFRGDRLPVLNFPQEDKKEANDIL